MGDKGAATNSTSAESATDEATTSATVATGSVPVFVDIRVWLRRLQEIVYRGAKWFADLPGTSGMWTVWVILAVILLVAPSGPNPAITYALALTLLIYFFLDDRGIVIWSGLGALMAFAQGSTGKILALKVCFPSLSIGMVAWCVWRWLCDTRIMNELDQAECAEAVQNYREITYRNVWAELVLSVALVLTACSWVSWGVLREPIFTAAAAGLGFAADSWPRTLDSLVDGSRILRYIAVTSIFTIAMVDASLVAAVVPCAKSRAMHPHHRHLYNWSGILWKLWLVVTEACGRFTAYLKSLGRSFIRILGLNFRLLGYLGLDILLRGPAALAIGALVYLGLGALLRGSGGAATVAIVGVAITSLAIAVQYRRISLDGVQSAMARSPNADLFMATFFINVLRVWCALLLACVIRYGLAKSRFAWVPVPRELWLAAIEVPLFLAALVLAASPRPAQLLRGCFRKSEEQAPRT
jgi:hypothetical protein